MSNLKRGSRIRLRTVACLALLLWNVGAVAAESDGIEDIGILEPFETLVRTFRGRIAEALGTEAVSTWTRPAVFLSRAAVADSASTLFNASEIRLEASYPKTRLDIPKQVIRTEKLSSINCSRDRWGCKSGCGTLDLGCHERKVRCELNKAAGIAACEAKKKAREAISDKKLLTASFSAVTISGRAETGLELQLARDLSRFEVAAKNPSATLTLHGGSATFRPEALPGLLTGCAPHTVTLPGTSVKVHETRVRLSGELDLRVDGAAPRLRVGFEVPEISLRFNHNPILGIVKKNLHTMVLCPIAYGVAFPLGSFADLVWNDRVSIPPSHQAFDVDFGEMTLDLPGTNVTIEPAINDLAIGFVGRSPGLEIKSLEVGS